MVNLPLHFRTHDSHSPYRGALAVSSVVAVGHVFGWLIASASDCTMRGVGLGGSVSYCTGTGSATTSLWVLFITISSAPFLLTALARRTGQRRPRLIGWVAEGLLPAITPLGFVELPQQTGKWFLWETTTQLVFVPLVTLLLVAAIGHRR